jgi:hypothetical protein
MMRRVGVLLPNQLPLRGGAHAAPISLPASTVIASKRRQPRPVDRQAKSVGKIDRLMACAARGGQLKVSGEVARGI